MTDEEIGDAIRDIQARTGAGWYGLSVGDGWLEVVADTHRLIALLFPDYEVHQIKEKFGGLRYYCSVDGDEHVQQIIRLAEARAWKTCEGCGTVEGVTTEGRLTNGWITTLCPTCRASR